MTRTDSVRRTWFGKASKRLAIAFTASGFVITCGGSVLLSQGSMALDPIGWPLQQSGLLITLTGLCAVLALSVAERRPADRRSRSWSAPSMKLTLPIAAARVTSIILLILGGIWIVTSTFQFLMAILAVRGVWLGMGGLLGIGSALLLFGGGLALWLIADIAQRLQRLEAGRTRTEPRTEQ